MSNHHAPERLLGERQRPRVIEALAGHPLEVDARHYCRHLTKNTKVSWEVDGMTSTGLELHWIPNRPGYFPILLDCGSQIIHLSAKVGIRPSDLIALREQLDYYFCLIASQRGRIVAHPIDNRQPASSTEAAKPKSGGRRYHKAIAKSVDKHASLYRKSFGVFPVIAQARWPSGLYAIFGGAMVHVGESSVVAQALEGLQYLADLPTGTPIFQDGFKAALAKLDLGNSTFTSASLFPETGTGTSTGSDMSRLIDALTALAGQYGVDIGTQLGNAGLSAILDINAQNSTIRTRLFGSGGITSQVESALGGFMPNKDNLFDFSHGSSSRWIPPGEKIGWANEGIRATSGWEKQTTDGWVPYTGNPSANGETGRFRHIEADGVTTTIYQKGETDAGTKPADGTPAVTPDPSQTPGSNSGTDQNGNKDDSETEDAAQDLFELDDEMQKDWQEKQKSKTTTGGDERPFSDDGDFFPQITEEQLKWVIITRSGSLFEHTTQDGDDTTGDTSTPIIPGGGVTDPPPPFFHEWTPTVDASTLHPRGMDPLVSDPVPEGDESGGTPFGSFPSTGSPKSGILGTTSSLSKTTSIVNGVLVESYSGVDDAGRRGDDIYGGIAIDLF